MDVPICSGPVVEAVLLSGVLVRCRGSHNRLVMSVDRRLGPVHLQCSKSIHWIGGDPEGNAFPLGSWPVKT